MTATIKLNPNQTVLKTAITAVQIEPWDENALSRLGIFLTATSDEVDEVKVLLIGGNSLKYSVPKGQGATEKTRIETELGW